jgi:5-methylcytosine-specific restriction endonuclease McrA
MGRKPIPEKEVECPECGKMFLQKQYTGSSFKRKYCTPTCSFKASSKKRVGKGNPAYVHGLRMKDKKKGVGYQNTKHLRACAKYKKQFLEKHGYLFCEHCGVNQNGTPRFEVHHIYFASLYPRHEELHNHKNLILLCIGCHNKFHAGKTFEKEFKKLEKERGLKQLFGNK